MEGELEAWRRLSPPAAAPGRDPSEPPGGEAAGAPGGLDTARAEAEAAAAAAEEQRMAVVGLRAELSAVRAKAEGQADALRLELAEARAEAEASRGQVQQERLKGTLAASEAWVDVGFNSGSPGPAPGAAQGTPLRRGGAGPGQQSPRPGGEAGGTPSPSQMSSFMSDASSLGDSPESQYMMLNAASGVLLLRKELESQMQLVTKVREENVSLSARVESLTAGNTAVAAKFKATLTKLTAALQETEDVKTELLLKEQAHRATLNALKQALRQKEEDLAATAQARAEALKKVIELQQEGGNAAAEAGEQHQGELQAAGEEKARLQRELVAATGKLEKATRDLDKASAGLAAAEQDLSTLRRESVRSCKALESAAAEKKASEELLDEARGETRRSEERCRALCADLETRGQELGAAAQAARTAETARERLEVESRELRDGLRRAQGEALEAARLEGASLAGLQNEVKGLTEQVGDLSERNERLLGERDELGRSLSGLQRAARDHEGAAEAWAKENARLTAALAAAQDEKATSTTSSTLPGPDAGLVEERDAARAELSEERTRMGELMQQFSQAKDALLEERDELQGRLVRLEGLVRDQKGSQAEEIQAAEASGRRSEWDEEGRTRMMEELAALRRSNAELREESDSLRGQLQEASASAQERLEAALSEVKGRSAAQEAEIRDLKAENEELTAESQTAMELGVTLAQISEKLEQQMYALTNFQEMDAENSQLREKLALATASKAERPGSSTAAESVQTPVKLVGGVDETGALFDKFSAQFERLRSSPQAAASTSPEKAVLYDAALKKLDALKSENGTLWTSLNEQTRAANKLADRAVSDAALCESMDRERQKLLGKLEDALQEKAAMVAQIARSELVIEQLQRTIARLGSENSELSDAVATLRKGQAGGGDSEKSTALSRVSGERDQAKLQLMQASHRLAKAEVELKAKSDGLRAAEEALACARADAPAGSAGRVEGGKVSQDLKASVQRLKQENAFLKSRCDILEREATNLQAEIVQKDILARRVAMEEKARGTPGPLTPGQEVSVACQTPFSDGRPLQRTRRNSAPGDVGTESGDRLHIIRALKAQTLKARHYKARIVSLEGAVSTLRTKHAEEMKRLEKKLQPTMRALGKLTNMQSPAGPRSRPSTAPLKSAGADFSPGESGKTDIRPALAAKSTYGKPLVPLKTARASRGAWK